ncbi:MAG: ABC-2 transporter permease [Firmicutes bacterium]|nr:ABC-2 transporter permease [Bacillota bacterium]
MAKVLRKDWLLLRPGLLFVSLTFGLLWNWLIWVDDPLAIHYSGSLLTLVFAFYLATMDGGSANMEAFWNSLPISRVELVGAKYLEGVLFAVGGYLLAWILQFPVRWIVYPDSLQFTPAEGLIGIATGLIGLAVFYGIDFWFHRGIGSTMTAFIIALALSFLFNQYMDSALKEGNALWVLLFAFCVLLYGGSYQWAKWKYRRKDIG